MNSLDYKELRKIFVDDVDEEDGENRNDKGKSKAILISVIVIINVVLIAGILLYRYIKNKKYTLSIDKIYEYSLI